MNQSQEQTKPGNDFMSLVAYKRRFIDAFAVEIAN